MSVIKNLGPLSAYAYAVSKGYSGTEEEFAEQLASVGDIEVGIPEPANPSNGQYLVYNGTAWVAQSLPVYDGGVS